MTPAAQRDTDELARRAGRWTGRWWRRNRAAVRRGSAGVRRRWAGLAAFVSLLLHVWVGAILGVGLQVLFGVDGPVTLVVSMGGGVLLGVLQQRRRLARTDDPDLAAAPAWWLAVWLVAVGLALLVDAYV